jgi:hypothetical protein
MALHIYAPPSRFDRRAEECRELLRNYPNDIFFLIQPMPSIWQESWQLPGYSWMGRPEPTGAAGGGLDSRVAMEDWSELPSLLDRWPNPSAAQPTPCEEDPLPRGDRYAMIHWWNCLYERAWHLRGMENLLMDFHLHPRQVHQLLDAIVDFNCEIIRRSSKEHRVHGVWVTEDIGGQNGPMFGLDIFRAFFRPRYKRMFDTAHECGMHFWLHSCGQIDLFMEDLVEMGLDVIHPIQKYTMDQREIARRFGGRISFWAGMDMQRILPLGSPEDVRREVRFLVDTFDRPEGGCAIALGNVVTSDVPLENLQAVFDEAYCYGQSSRSR